ncbi:MAG: depupylase/deamidase Dop [Corynebacterium sp.]|nr:depupylase/deamidase Dop [Corynebacterium sp.]
MRYLGTETEYGIATPSNPALSPIVTSTHAVVAYAIAENLATGVRWDYGLESPLRDIRGFDLRRYTFAPQVDPQAIGIANVMLRNGGRFYVDHAHPEYASPETTNARAALAFDLAGDAIMGQAVQHVAQFTAENRSVLEGHDPCPELKIYRNNVDGKGASYGSHENYLYPRSLDFQDLVRGLTPWFVVRQVLCGAGRLGIGQRGEQPGFQISQRADYIETEISLETTLNRGIINTRDEPHADAEQFGRLHVIIGDANMAHTSGYLKLGLTSLIIAAINAGAYFEDLQLEQAVREVQAVSHDLTLSHLLKLRDGRELTALDIIEEYLHRISPYATQEVDREVLQLAAHACQALRRGPQHAAHLLDWCAKWALIDSYIQRGVSIDSPKLALIDLQYSDIDPARSLYHALVRKGRIQEILDPMEIARAGVEPPEDSRAYGRGRLLAQSQWPVLSANWDAVTLENEPNSQVTIRMPRLDSLAKEEFDARIFPDGDLNRLLGK